MPSFTSAISSFCGVALVIASLSCQEAQKIRPEPVSLSAQPSTGFQNRHGDEIIVAGRLYRINAPVVTWLDPGGYDAYRVERRFVPFEESSWAATTRAVAANKSDIDPSSPNRHNLRNSKAATQAYSPETLEQIRGGGWTLEQLQQVVDQFVLHYDVAGTSRQCFKILHDYRGLSVHFMLDLDGTIYQTLDLKDTAWHATISNPRSIGIEIANMGAYSTQQSTSPLTEWYPRDATGQTYIAVPPRLGGMSSQRIQYPILRPARNSLITGSIHGQTYRMYDLTPQQYDSLIKLTAALCDIFPQIQCDYPRDASGKLLTTNLSPESWETYKGILGHYHIQRNKTDPGPAFQWDYVIQNAQNLLASRKARYATTQPRHQ